MGYEHDPDDIHIDDFLKPWRVCPSCHQDYLDALAVDIANKFGLVVEREHPNERSTKAS
jgi:hypothetical protein